MLTNIGTDIQWHNKYILYSILLFIKAIKIYFNVFSRPFFSHSSFVSYIRDFRVITFHSFFNRTSCAFYTGLNVSCLKFKCIGMQFTCTYFNVGVGMSVLAKTDEWIIIFLWVHWMSAFIAQLVALHYIWLVSRRCRFNSRWCCHFFKDENPTTSTKSKLLICIYIFTLNTKCNALTLNHVETK